MQFLNKAKDISALHRIRTTNTYPNADDEYIFPCLYYSQSIPFQNDNFK